MSFGIGEWETEEERRKRESSKFRMSADMTIQRAQQSAAEARERVDSVRRVQEANQFRKMAHAGMSLRKEAEDFRSKALGTINAAMEREASRAEPPGGYIRGPDDPRLRSERMPAVARQYAEGLREQPSTSPSSTRERIMEQIGGDRWRALSRSENARLLDASGISMTDDERQRLLALPVETVRQAIAAGNIGLQGVDIGSPSYGPEGAPLPGVVGKIPGFRTLPEAAATVGTAGVGTYGGLLTRAGLIGAGQAGASAGELGGPEIVKPFAPDEYASLAAIPGALVGGLAAGTGGARLGSAFDRAIAREGGFGALGQRVLTEEQGGIALPFGRKQPTQAAVETVEEAAPLSPWESARNKVIQNIDEQEANYQRVKEVRGGEAAERFTNYDDEFDRLVRAGEDPGRAHIRASEKLKGEYSKQQPVTISLTEEEKWNLWQRVDEVYANNVYNRGNARNALYRLDQDAPLRQFEVNLLRHAYGDELADALMQSGRVRGGFWNFMFELAVTPKAILSSMDLSYPLRQGILMAPGRPREFFQSFKPMFKAGATEEGAQAIYKGIVTDPMEVKMADGTVRTFGQMMDEAGAYRHLETFDAPLVRDETGKAVYNAGQGAEEAFRGGALAESLTRPLGNFVRRSNRAFTTFGNAVRHNVGKSIIKGWMKAGEDITPERIQALSNFLNRFSGRGTIGNANITQALQAFAWAPQKTVAGPQAWAHAFHADPLIRKQAWRNLAAFMGTGLTIMGGAYALGARVQGNPLSSDFGKIQVGKRHINIWGSDAVLMRYIAQTFTPRNLSTDPKRAFGIFNEEGALDIGQRLDPNLGVVPSDPVKSAGRYGRSRLAPEWGAVWDVVSGRSYLGEPIRADKDSLLSMAKNYGIPLVAQDAIEALKEEGLTPESLALTGGTTAFSFFGGTAQTYGPSAVQELGSIPEFKGLSPRESYDLKQFADHVTEIEKDWRAELPAGEEPWWSREDALRLVAQREGHNQAFADWAVALNSTKRRAELRNPEWVDFVVQNYNDLKDYKDFLYDKNYIIDAAREAGVEVR